MPAKVVDFAEALQAEAEQISLMSASPTSSTTASTQDTKKEEHTKAAALRSEGAPTTNEEGKGKPKCRVSHKDLSKLKDPKGGSPKNADAGHGKGGQKGGATTATPTTPLPSSSMGSTATSSTSQASEEKSKVVIEEVKPTIPPALVSDISGLVKSLQSLKAVHLRYIESKSDGIKGSDLKLALLDGGATHGLRRGTADELAGAEMVTVELAHGSTTLFRKAGCRTLLSKEDVEPIIPVRQLIDAGYQLKWSSSEVSIWHPSKGAIRCWRRHKDAQ
eukprot:s898_g18.t1